MTDSPRSPIKDKPLRAPGQSLEEQRRTLLEDKVMAPLTLALVVTVITGLEWWRYFSNQKPNPLVYSAFAIALIAFAVWRIYRLRPILRNLHQGIEGEKAVGQFLERLRERGYQVFHDVVGDNFNVDHVLIGPGGVFTIETKTWSKSARGEARIGFDGEQLTRNGKLPERAPIVQARAQSTWLKGLLNESSGRKVEVHPVVLFPGWFIEQSEGSTRDMWVLEPKALPAFLDRRGAVLGLEEVKLLSFHLSRFIRSSERERDG